MLCLGAGFPLFYFLLARRMTSYSMISVPVSIPVSKLRRGHAFCLATSPLFKIFLCCCTRWTLLSQAAFTALVLSFLADKPCVALSYDRKVDALMTDVGLKDYCLDIRSFVGENAFTTFLNLQANGPQVASKLRVTCCHYDQLLQSQFRLVTKLRGSGLSNSTSDRAVVASDEHLYEPRSDAGPHG